MIMRPRLALALLTWSIVLLGCVHRIAFNEADPKWHYAIDGPRHDGAALVAVIDQKTLANTYSFRAFSTGIAQKWVAEYGKMLAQVSDVEFPQLVGVYARSLSYEEPSTGNPRLTLDLSVPSYTFADYHATITVHVDAYGTNKTLLFSSSYTGNGANESGKMVGLGAFGQLSAVRQSSLGALKDAFAKMRPDILAVLEGGRASSAARARETAPVARTGSE
jgi:hypothetical protein